MTEIRQPYFNFAHTFYIDPGIVNHQTTISITSIDLYFMHKPPATGNRSGIDYPGITMYLTETIFDVPKITKDTFNQFARCDWTHIITSSDATYPVRFTFNSPVKVIPGQQYAFVVSFDGNETFNPWTAKSGMWIVGSRNVYSGNAGKFIGKYYEFITPGDTTNRPENASTQYEYLSYWSALNDTVLKFSVNAARYFVDGVPVANVSNLPVGTFIHKGNLIEEWDAGSNTFTYDFPSTCTEAIAFDLDKSTVQMFIGAQRVFQNTVSYPGGVTPAKVSCNSSITVTANTSLPNGAAFNWNTVFNGYSGTKFLTFNDNGTYNVRKVTSIVNNTVIQLDEPLTISNTAATFMVAPVGTVAGTLASSPYGKSMSFLFLTHSSANSTVRFVNNCIESVSVAAGAGGTGYNNADVFYVKGFENVVGIVTGGYVAVGNVVTNGSGGITSIALSNLGCGFVNTSSIAVVFANSTNIGNTTGNTSAGSGATVTYTVGATLCTEMTTNVFRNCIISNFNIDDILPFFNITAPVGTTYTTTITSQYNARVDPTTYSGFAYFVNGTDQEFPVLLNKRTRFITNTPAAFISYSNEFKTLYSNGAVNDKVSALSPFSNNFILKVETHSNNDYLAVSVDTTPTVELGKYIINNDDTKEYTNSGNAWAKHITKRINFTRLSEDIKVYLTAYKPVGSDIKVYARIQNSSDPEAFTDEDWTLLTLSDGNNILSSTTDLTDFIELTYNFNPWGNVDFTIVGTVTTTNNSVNILGSGTQFQTNATANIAAGDLVRIYNPLFSNDDFLVASVNNVVSDTSLNIDQRILSTINAGFVGSGLFMDHLQLKHQAYNDVVNSNVVTYYNSSLHKFAGYDILALKIVMLTSQLSHVPMIHNVRCVGVSA